MIAFLKPAFSKAGCQASTPFLIQGRHFVGHLAADVEDDRLLRLGDLGLGVLLLEPPAGDVPDLLDLVLADVAVVLERLGEEARRGRRSLRGFIGSSGSLTMLWWSRTVTPPGRIAAEGGPPARSSSASGR